jgi:predicted aconitase
MTIRNTILAATSALVFVSAAHADSLRPIEARSIDLGAISGVAYYTVERDGFRVVLTLAQQGEDTAPVRFETVLAPGQSVVLSTPREVGITPDVVEFSRRNDQLLIQAVVTN